MSKGFPKSIIRSILVLLIFGAFFAISNFVPPIQEVKAAGNTYYVRADGTVTCPNKATATSPNNANTSLNMAQVTACTFAAGDQVLFSSQGGNYTALLTVPSGGSGVGSEITYANVPNETPVFAIISGNTLDTNTKSNIIIQGLTVNYTGLSASTNIGVTIKAGSNIQFKNFTSDMGGFGYNIWSNVVLSDIVFDHVTLTNCRASSLICLSLSGSSSGNLTITNSTFAGNISNITTTGIVTIGSTTLTGGLSINNSTNVLISNIPSVTALTLTNAAGGTISNVIGSNGTGFDFINSSNITINDSSMTGGTTYGAFQARGTSHDITYNRDTAKNISSSGFVAGDTSYNITYNNCVADNNGAIGFLSHNSVHDITYRNSEASYNGAVNNVFDGAGFLPHDSATNINCYSCISHHNYTAGIGDVSTGTNLFYNSVTWANGYAMGDIFKGSVVTTPSTRGNIYMSGNKSAGSVTIKNTISSEGKPREITSVANSAYVSLDYNLYYPLDNSKFFSSDAGHDVSWTTYHATNEQHSLNADPLFVNASGLYNTVTDFMLTALSPAIDAGFDTSIATDYAGNTRRDDFLVANTGGGTLPYYDIGAYEYVAPLSIVPSAPTINATSSSSLTVIINTNSNIDSAEYAISCDSDTTFLNYTTNACEAISDDADHWRTYTNWGGIGGFVDTGLIANTQHIYKVKARNGDHVATALSSGTTQTTLAIYTLTYSAGSNGSIVGTSSQTIDHGASGTEVTATPASGYYFVSWSDNVLTAARTDVNITADITVTATFATTTTSSTKKKHITETIPVQTTVPNEIPTTEEIINEIVNTSHDYSVSAPTASFTMTSDNTTGSTVTFDASGSTSNKGIVKYEWDFGDWEKAEGMKVEHEYSSPGRYTVTLTVTDRVGNKNTTTKTVDIKPAAPTITNITAKSTALWIEGKADPNTTIYFTIHSNLFEGQGLANKDGYWTYYLDNASEVLGEGDHTIVALAAVKLADDTELKGVESKTYDFKMNVDNGKLKVETQKTRVWQIATGIIGSLFVLLIVFLVFRRRRA